MIIVQCKQHLYDSQLSVQSRYMFRLDESFDKFITHWNIDAFNILINE